MASRRPYHGIVCFALRGAAEGEHARRAQVLAGSGFACLSSTRLKGCEVLRLRTINPLRNGVIGPINRRLWS
ncbi:MAG: hypothetical protein KDI44_00450 [Thiothrix sp.]|nr:hypothetical protein [Thiothrix sp.]